MPLPWTHTNIKAPPRSKLYEVSMATTKLLLFEGLNLKLWMMHVVMLCDVV